MLTMVTEFLKYVQTDQGKVSLKETKLELKIIIE